MRNRRTLIITAAALVSLAVALLAGLITAPRLQAQSPATQSPAVPQWQIDAGGKMAFEVASIKPNKGRPPLVRSRSNVPLDDGDGFPPNGGLFSWSDIGSGGVLDGTALRFETS